MENITRTQTTITKPAPIEGGMAELGANKLMLQDLIARNDGSYEAYQAEHSIEVPAELIEFEGTVSAIGSTGSGRPLVTVTAGTDSTTIAMSRRQLGDIELGSGVRGSYNMVEGDVHPSNLTIAVI